MTAQNINPAKPLGVSSKKYVAALMLVAAFGLAGCSDIDTMLFGDSALPSDSQTIAPTYTPPSDTAAPAAYAPQTGGVTAPVATITPLVINPGSDTGTDVSKTIASLRSTIVGLQGAIRQNAGQLAALRNAGAASSATYYAAKGIITARLQVGTTRGNPELVARWNQAQAALDQLTVNINGLNALAKAVAENASSAHFTLDQITATFNVSGAVDEDHRQLNVLEDETNQTIVLIDRLLKEAADDVQRQTATVANERANLTTLASAIKNGELYGGDIAPPMMGAAGGPGGVAAASGSPLVVIRFDRPNVDYQQILYAALRQALKTRPNAGFSVVAVAPTRGTAAAVQLAQTDAHRRAQEVVRSMTDMGVPASRLNVASATDPSVTSSEVRVYVR